MASHQLGLFERPQQLGDEARPEQWRWPPQARFPINDGDARSVGKQLRRDMEGARELCVITGFGSLEYLVATLGAASFEKRLPGRVRIVFGHEPMLGRGLPTGDPRRLPALMRDWWLAHGISLENAPALLRVMALIKEGTIEARHVSGARRVLHAKIYLTDRAAMLGSSNFTRAGMHEQLEFNARFSASEDPDRYKEVRQAAENFWRMASDFTEELLRLLAALVQPTSFEEAVARACAEILECEWAQELLDGEGGVARLWPTQIKGIARALWILEREGSCLVADATGAGKTRMGVHLLKALQRRMQATGRWREGPFVLISPPGDVRRAWERERARCGIGIAIHSHGLLSKKEAEGVVREDIRRAQCLAIDEAHNFLNPKSNRTRRLMEHVAEHVVLFTATPINRGAQDLIGIVELLGADNLDEGSLRLFDGLMHRLRRQRAHFALSSDERERLRRIVGRFMLRRTKADLKREIAQNPQGFLDDQGRPCSYPEHVPCTYRTQETPKDQETAEKIRKLAQRLRGLAYLEGGIIYPEALKGRMSEAKFVDARINSAKGIAYYQVMASLRSSRAA
ncbi:MAG: helicase, partial [Zetaproteobacteria bacterium]